MPENCYALPDSREEIKVCHKIVLARQDMLYGITWYPEAKVLPLLWQRSFSLELKENLHFEKGDSHMDRPALRLLGKCSLTSQKRTPAENGVAYRW